MKKEDKKVPDSPYRMFVYPFYTGLTSGWIDQEGKQHAGFPVWHGMAVRMGRDDEEYINLCKVWHPGKELPESEDNCLLCFEDSSYDIGHRTEDFIEFDGWRTDFGLYKFEEIVQWAYLKDIVPALVNYKKEAQDEKK